MWTIHPLKGTSLRKETGQPGGLDLKEYTGQEEDTTPTVEARKFEYDCPPKAFKVYSLMKPYWALWVFGNIKAGATY